MRVISKDYPISFVFLDFGNFSYILFYSFFFTQTNLDKPYPNADKRLLQLIKFVEKYRKKC